MSKSKSTPPDQAQRERILGELDATMLVEAGAGTGKTTCMIGRMVALLREGKCAIDALAAVTFTRKAAAELRARFQVALEQAARTAAGAEGERLAEASAHIERCFIGTIHSFCGRLLRERPVEADVDLAFEEADDAQDQQITDQAWADYVAALHARGDPILDELNDVGLDISQVQKAYRVVTLYPDVDDWPAAPVAMPDLLPATEALRQYAAHMRELIATFPADVGRDGLMPRYRTIERASRVADLTVPAELMSVLELFGNAEIVQKNWPGGGKQAKDEKARYDAFVEQYVEPLRTAWREHRYAKVMRAALPAAAACRKLRASRGVLNFQDLLMSAATLLKGKPQVREYFSRRFTHLLVDEFQDTDPIQAQVMLYLTADDPKEADWRRCRPVAGSLFVVGDPKQSIYRFRRADIVTYNQVKQIIQGCGTVVQLNTNFRAQPCLTDWVNGVFAKTFPSAATEFAPADVPLKTGNKQAKDVDLVGLSTLTVPLDQSDNKNNAATYDADFIARLIRKALDDGMTVARTERELEAGVSPKARCGDFMILSYKKELLGLYAKKLEQLGIPHQVTGGSALNQVSELAMLCACLRAVTEPDNPIALVAALRSELFGASDQQLYAFRKAGGRFSFRSAVPEGLDDDTRAALADAMEKFTRYATWLARMAPAAAVEKIAADLGLTLRACVQAGGDVQAGSLAKAIELLRAAQADTWSAAGLVDLLGRMVHMDQPYDGISALPPREEPVRLMNLHKAKGLEAPVVLLACPDGCPRFEPELYVDRGADKSSACLVLTQQEGFQRRVLAQPAGWDELAGREQQFMDAERDRLQYVAATRAGSALVISQRKKGNTKNFWKFFEPHLAAAEERADPGPREAPAAEHRELSNRQIEQAAADIAARWQKVLTPSYQVAGMKQFAISSTTGVPPMRDAGVSPASDAGILPARREGVSPSQHEQDGASWGSTIHTLLEASAKEPNADLLALAKEVLAQCELPLDRAAEAVATVKAVLQSPLWRRAAASACRLVEAPLCIASPATDGCPATILRGVVDLAFLEDGGWVIADYKTDAAAAQRPQEVMDHYRPQLAAYADAWCKVTNQPVKEIGLYFTVTGSYHELPLQ